MKPLFSKLLIGVLVAILPTTNTHACDICGCASSSNPMGVLALTQQHMVGARWGMQSYHSRPHGTGVGAQERFMTAESWTRWQVNPRLQVTGIVPLRFNSRLLDDGAQHEAYGLGDISLLGSLHLLSPKKQALRRWKHFLLLSMGAALPTGQYRKTDQEGNLLHSNIQPGTGNVTLTASAIYMVRYRNWGLLLEKGQQRSVWQRDVFRPGNRNQSATRAIHFIKAKKALLAPYLGGQYEHLEYDYNADGRISESGGDMLLGTTGLDCFWGRFALSADVQVPLQHQLSKGFVTPRPRCQFGIAFNLYAPKKTVNSIQTPKPFENIVPNTHQPLQHNNI